MYRFLCGYLSQVSLNSFLTIFQFLEVRAYYNTGCMLCCVVFPRCLFLRNSTHQFTPFHRACSQGHGDVLVELLKAREPGIKGGGRRGGEGEGGRLGSGRLARALGGGSGNIGGSFRRGGGGGSGNLTPTHGLRSEVVDIRNHFQATPLHRAAAKGHAEVTWGVGVVSGGV